MVEEKDYYIITKRLLDGDSEDLQERVNEDPDSMPLGPFDEWELIEDPDSEHEDLEIDEEISYDESDFVSVVTKKIPLDTITDYISKERLWEDYEIIV